MADATHTTKFSRRTILAGTTATTVSAIAFPALAAWPSDPDAALLRRIALIDRLGEKYVARQERHRRRIKARYHHRQRWTEAGPTWPGLGYWPADPDGWRMFDRYAAAVRSALVAPAHTPRGILAKLKLARQAARTGDRRVYLYEDIDWLDPVLVDLERRPPTSCCI